MPTGQWNLEWLNHNSQRHYPFAADSSKTDSTSSFTIPDDFLVGLDLPVSPAMDMETGRFFLRQLAHYGNGFQLVIAYETAISIVDVAIAVIPSNVLSRNSVFDLSGLPPFEDVKGKIVVGRTDSISQQPTGLFTFTLASARIEPQAIRPAIQGISSFRIVTAGGGLGERLYGDIEFVAGPNIQLSTATTPTGAKILISALSGEGTIEQCLCEGESAPLPCITTINGIPGTPDGDFTFVGDNCLNVLPEMNGIRLSNDCAQPCCGCEELAQITAELELFRSQRNDLQRFVSALEAETRAFNVVVLGARLGDRTCQNCDE